MENTMQTHMNAAKELLFGANGLLVKDVKLFPGYSRDATPDQMSAQIVAAISAIESGDFEDITDCDD